MKRFNLILAGLFALALAGGYLFASGRISLDLDQYAPKQPGGDFELQSLSGPVKLSDFREKVVLIYFGYTYCPDICPVSLALTSAAMKQMETSELEQLQSILISVDPGRDSVERLSEFVSFFHPDIIGLTGTKAQIDDVTRRFGVYYRIAEDAPAENYAVDHSSQTLLIGKDGEIKEVLAHGTLSDDVLTAVRKYL